MDSSLTGLEQIYDGPIPGCVLTVLRFGSHEMVALVRARGELAFFRSMVRGHIKIIRSRRADGSFYPALIDDLQLYRQHFRKWHQCAIDARHAFEKRHPTHIDQTIPIATDPSRASLNLERSIP